MDPAQRLVLESSYSALHNSGHHKSSLLGTPVGVYVGANGGEFGSFTGAQNKSAEVGPYSATAGLNPNSKSARPASVVALQETHAALTARCY